MDGKRKRNTNFSKREEELLVELVYENRNIIENKKTDAVMWKQKEESWAKITAHFNSQGLSVFRTVSQLQLKYKNLKKVVRKKSASIRLELIRTGGGTNNSKPLDLVEEKLKDMIQLSVDGLPSTFDNDIVETAADNVIDAESGSQMNGRNPYYVTVMSDDTEDFGLIEQETSVDYDQPGATEGISYPIDLIFNEPGTSVSYEQPGTTESISCPIDKIREPGPSVSREIRWDSVTPQNLNRKKSTPLRAKKRVKSHDVEDTNMLIKKSRLQDLQLKCLEQEVAINDVRKRNIILEEEKLKLEIELLKKKLDK